MSSGVRLIQTSCLNRLATRKAIDRWTMKGWRGRRRHESPMTCPSATSRDSFGLRRNRLDVTWTAWCPASTGRSTVSLLGMEPTTLPSITTCHADRCESCPTPRPGVRASWSPLRWWRCMSWNCAPVAPTDSRSNWRYRVRPDSCSAGHGTLAEPPVLRARSSRPALPATDTASSWVGATVHRAPVGPGWDTCRSQFQEVSEFVPRNSSTITDPYPTRPAQWRRSSHRHHVGVHRPGVGPGSATIPSASAAGEVKSGVRSL